MTTTKRGYLNATVALVLLVAVTYALFSPELPVGRDRRVILYLFCSLAAALLFGSSVLDRVELKGPGIGLVLSGSMAGAFGAFALLMYFSRPEEVIVVFDIVDSTSRPVALHPSHAISVTGDTVATNPAYAVDKTSLFVVFRDDMGAVIVSIQPTDTDPVFVGRIEMPARARKTLRFGTDLKPRT